jgi:transposase
VPHENKTGEPQGLPVVVATCVSPVVRSVTQVRAHHLEQDDDQDYHEEEAGAALPRQHGEPAVSERIVYLWLQQEREEARTAAKPHAGGVPSRFDAALVRTLHDEQPDVTLAECAARYTARSGVVISVSSVERLVQALDLRRKKKDAARR